MNELNEKRIEFRTNRKALLNQISDTEDNIDSLKIIRNCKLKSIDGRCEVGQMNKEIDRLIIHCNTLTKQLFKLEQANPQMNF